MNEETRRGEEESGVRGGAVPAYMPGVYVETAERGMLLKDRARWAAIWGGFLTYFALWIWFAGIGAAIWLSAARPGVSAFGPGFAVWTGVAGLTALFIGGVVASRLAGISGTMNGLWNGVVLWGLSFTLLFLLASLGVGGMFGQLVGGAAGGAARPAVTGPTLYTAAASAWWFVIFQLLALIAAAGGGALGIQRSVEETEVPER